MIIVRTMISRQTLTDRVEKGVGHPVVDWLWKEILDEAGSNRITGSRNPEPAILRLVRTIQQREAKMAAYLKSVAKEPKATRREREIPGDRRLEALSAILAINAAGDEGVRAFRRKALRGKLIRLDGVPGWVERQAKKEGEPTLYARVQLDGRGHAPSGSLRHPRLGVTPDFSTIEYPGTDGWVASLPIRAGGILEPLANLGARLEGMCSWQKAQAIGFVLTGIQPTLPLARARLEMRLPMPARSRVVLELSPRLTSTEVRDLYLKARSGEFFGDERFGLQIGRIRAMSDEAARLAVFIVEQNDGRPWGQAMREWNRLNPEAKKTSVPGFTNLARDAYRRVTGEPLAWKRGRGQKVTTQRPRGRSKKG